ncbi:MAG: two-component regulator propeller domain-containing protein [Bacteroidota bacterium]
MNACNGQVQEKPPKAPAPPTSLTKPPPKIIGPAPTMNAGPMTDPSLVSQYVRCIFQDSRGHYWFGPAGESVVRYDGETLRYFSRLDFFQGNPHVESDYGNSVHAIAEDHKGHLWFGTHYGAVKYDGTRFRNYTEKDGLTNLAVGRQSILTDRQGTVWVGTGAGVFQYDAQADSAGAPAFSRFQALPEVHVMDILEDQAGHLWFASETQGIFRYDGTSMQNLTQFDGLGESIAGGIAQDANGDYWFTMKGGICKYDGTDFTPYTTEDGLGGSEVWGLCLDATGKVWVSARGSTTRFDPSAAPLNSEAFRVWTPEDGVNCCVQSMHLDREGKMWWGAGSGLFRFDGEGFYQVRKVGPWD